MCPSTSLVIQACTRDHLSWKNVKIYFSHSPRWLSLNSVWRLERLHKHVLLRLLQLLEKSTHPKKFCHIELASSVAALRSLENSLSWSSTDKLAQLANLYLFASRCARRSCWTVWISARIPRSWIVLEPDQSRPESTSYIKIELSNRMQQNWQNGHWVAIHLWAQLVSNRNQIVFTPAASAQQLFEDPEAHPDNCKRKIVWSRRLQLPARFQRKRHTHADCICRRSTLPLTSSYEAQMQCWHPLAGLVVTLSCHGKSRTQPNSKHASLDGHDDKPNNPQISCCCLTTSKECLEKDIEMQVELCKNC